MPANQRLFSTKTYHPDADAIDSFRSYGYLIFDTDDPEEPETQVHKTMNNLLNEYHGQIFRAFPDPKDHLLVQYFYAENEQIAASNHINELEDATLAPQATPTPSIFGDLFPELASVEVRQIDDELYRRNTQTLKQIGDGRLFAGLEAVHTLHRGLASGIARKLWNVQHIDAVYAALIMDRGNIGPWAPHIEDGLIGCASNFKGNGTIFIGLITPEKNEELKAFVRKPELRSWNSLELSLEDSLVLGLELFPDPEEYLELHAGQTICFPLDDSLWGSESYGYLHSRPFIDDIEGYRASVFSLYTRPLVERGPCFIPRESSD